MSQAVVIDPEFRSLVPPLRPDELAQLEANLLAEGCRDPLVVWHGSNVLLDGHNRFDICTRHGIDFGVKAMHFDDREAAADWIDANQLGRRNLSPEHYSLLRGRRYNRTKRDTPNPEGKNRNGQVDGQNVHQPTTAETLAEQHGVDERTIRRDGRFAAAVEIVKAVDPDIEAKVIRGDAPPKAAIVQAAKVIEEAEEEADEEAATPLLSAPQPDPRPAAREEARAILSGEAKGPASRPRPAATPARDEPAEEWEDNAALAVAPPPEPLPGQSAILFPEAEPASVDLEEKADRFESWVNKLFGYSSALAQLPELDREHYHLTPAQKRVHINRLERIRKRIDDAIAYLKGDRP
jgi:hypothetical protein